MYEYDLQNELTKKVNPNFTEKEAVYNDINNIVTISTAYEYNMFGIERIVYPDMSHWKCGPKDTR